MKPTRTRGAVVVGAVVVSALAVGTGLAGCSAFQSCEEQDRRTLAELRALWPDELGTNDWNGGACDGDDPMYLVGTSSGSAQAAAVLVGDGWVLDADYPEDGETATVYRRTVAHHDYLFWVGGQSDTDLELERA
jgi:hypothetical protein